MATGLKIWVYRPDIEAQDRKFNKYFVYNLQGEKYFDVLDRENVRKTQIQDLKDEIRKRVLDYTVEVPHE